jgi:hypothetical protein
VSRLVTCFEERYVMRWLTGVSALAGIVTD